MARLLVVDDEPDICDLVIKLMMRVGHEIVAADNALTALTLVDRHGAPDAVILDVCLNDGIDGFALLARLRLRHPGLPALFLTVLWDADVRAEAKAAGAEHLEKPFAASALDQGVNRMLAAGISGMHPVGDP